MPLKSTGHAWLLLLWRGLVTMGVLVPCSSRGRSTPWLKDLVLLLDGGGQWWALTPEAGPQLPPTLCRLVAFLMSPVALLDVRSAVYRSSPAAPWGGTAFPELWGHPRTFPGYSLPQRAQSGRMQAWARGCDHVRAVLLLELAPH